MPGRVRSACRKIEAAGLSNARILEIEISYAVRHLLPAASVAVFHLMFPDPWPKRRHSPRRIVTEDFSPSLQLALVPEGTLRIATDEIDYFRKIERLASLFAWFCRDFRSGNAGFSEHIRKAVPAGGHGNSSARGAESFTVQKRRRFPVIVVEPHAHRASFVLP